MTALADTAQPGVDRARLPPHELFAVALQELRTRQLRAALSALGIAIGIGAMVAVVGVSASAQANLIAEIDSLGTNLLTVSPGTSFLGQNEVLPDTSVPMIGHMQHVLGDAAIYQLSSESVYRSPYVPTEQTGGIGVDAAGENLPQVVGPTLASGRFLNAVSDRFPEAVLALLRADRGPSRRPPHRRDRRPIPRHEGRPPQPNRSTTDRVTNTPIGCGRPQGSLARRGPSYTRRGRQLHVSDFLAMLE